MAPLRLGCARYPRESAQHNEQRGKAEHGGRERRSVWWENEERFGEFQTRAKQAALAGRL